MGKFSEIQWTDHTFNPWWGCQKVSPGCEHCYAETWAKRTGHKVWGGTAERRFFGDKHWAEPLKWNRDAEEYGVRKRVFCASMSDVFEDRYDLDKSRVRLWQLIETTPWLDWQLLTKRPQNILGMVPWSEWPANLWIGTTVENQAMAQVRIPILAAVPARVRFLSCEPMLEALELKRLVAPIIGSRPAVDWIICGGESGGKSRPFEADWARGLRDFCNGKGIPFFFKQWGGVRKHETGRVLDGRTWDMFPVVK